MKNIIRKLLTFTSLLALFGGALKAQSDFDFSQRWFNESLYNPAAAGNSFSTSIFLHSRQQWLGFNNAPTTFAVSFDTYMPSIRSGLGVTAAADRIGITSTYNPRLAYAFYIQTGEKSILALGLSGGVMINEKRVGPDQVDDPSDPELAFGNATEYSPDFDFGVEFKGPFKLGVTVRHIGVKPPSSNFPQHSLNVWAYASSRFNVGRTVSLEPLASATYRNNVLRWEGGFLAYFFKNQTRDTYNDRFWVGAVFRTDNNFAVMAGMNLTPKLRLGYSFDYGVGEVANLTKYGSHEIFLSYQFNRKFYKEPDCPAYKTFSKRGRK